MTAIDPCRLYVGTDEGAYVLDVDGDEGDDGGDAGVGGDGGDEGDAGVGGDGGDEGNGGDESDPEGARRVGSGLDGEAVREFAVDPRDPDRAFVACGLRGWGLHLTRDGGETFESVGFDEEWVWGVSIDPSDPDVVYAGTEPPMVYRSDDGGETWTDFPAIDDLPTRDRWTFFYDPFEAGHVHGIAVDPTRPERVYAAVEHGAMVYTHDGGETWRDGMAGADAHDTLVVPADPDRVLLSVGGGLYLSEDAAETWTAIDRFDGLYVKDLQASPHDPETVYVDATSGSGSDDAGIYRSTDRGDTWASVGAVPPASVTGCELLAVHPDDPDVLFHATHGEDGSRVVVSTDGGETWTAIGPDLPHVRAVTAAPLPD